MNKKEQLLQAYERLVEGDSPYDIIYGHCKECQEVVRMNPDHGEGRPQLCEGHLPLSNFQ